MGENLDLKEVLKSYTKHWKWFLFTIIIAIGMAFVYIRYATPEYSAEANIQIVEENSEGGINLFKDMDILSMGKNNVLDEIELLYARSSFIKIAEKLKLNTQIRVVGNIKTSEVYTAPPIKINFIAADSIINKSDFNFFIELNSDTSFSYSEEEDAPSKVYAFGNNIKSPIGDIVITPDSDVIGSYIGKTLKVGVQPITNVADFYRNQINISNIDEKSNILNIELTDPDPKKARDIINELIIIYNENAILDKKLIADRTAAFINERIADISTSLSSVDESAESLRTDRGITDIATETGINLSVGATNRQELSSIQNQLNIASSMKEILEQQEDSFDVLPTNLGLSDPTIANTTANYNNLVQERKRLLKSSNAKNPVIVNLDQQISSLQRTMKASLNSTVNNLGLTANNLSGQQAIINSRIYSAPKNERALRDITRQQETTEQLYLYLLQKREEAQIAVASTSPKSKIIDWAYNSNNFPISPRKRLIYMSAFLLGLLIPIGVIYAKDLLDTKVHNLSSLENYSRSVPILGELPRITRKQNKILVNDDRSVLAESLRILRTNLDYVIKTKRTIENKNNIIFVTSSIPGEGKTFVASNLSMILASTQKKVLLIGADIRNPKIFSFFTAKDSRNKGKKSENGDNLGLTEYLFDNTLNIHNIIDKISVHSNNIDVIYSGSIPPNPAEILMNGRSKELFERASELYDYVIVDTAPLMVVTDTLLISEFADHVIYVTRAGFTDKKDVAYPLKLQEEGKIKGLALVVNDVDDANLGYGGKYGYGYGKSMKKWWRF